MVPRRSRARSAEAQQLLDLLNTLGSTTFRQLLWQRASELDAVKLPYICIAAMVLVWAALVACAKFPPVDRGRGGQALAEMTDRARVALGRSRQIVIFPEGTRRAPGAEPSYKFGIAHLYGETGMMCLPIALNSGLFWPRRSFLRYPGTIVAEILDPIPPGLTKAEFAARLQHDIEIATARLIAEGERELAQSGISSQEAGNQKISS